MNKEIDANQVVEASTTNNEDFSEVLVDCEDFLNSNSCVQVNEPIVIKSLESSQEQTDSIDDLNTRIGGKPILQIIPRPELVVFPLEASVETALEANAPSLTESVIDVNNDQEKHKIAEPSRNLLKSSILAESDSPKREESFQAIKDSLKQAASNLNKKMKNVNETLPSGEKNSTDNNKSNNDKSNEIVFCKIFEFNKNETKSSKRSLKFGCDLKATSQSVAVNFDEFKLSIREASTPRKVTNNTNNRSVTTKTDDFFNSKFKQFIRKPRNIN